MGFVDSAMVSFAFQPLLARRAARNEGSNGAGLEAKTPTSLRHIGAIATATMAAVAHKVACM